MAPRRVGRRRGRAWVALALLGFVLIGAGVIWRRAAGIAQAREVRALEQQRLQLQAERAQLESDIRTLSSRSMLVPIAERRLGMHIPSDTQVVIIPRIIPAP
ncbi:MAG: cell division protein FtsL [Gemmatimonadaceae bacterium]|nr:cell division protein FtsL [Gemmatimonadaceae bacterium]